MQNSTPPAHYDLPWKSALTHAFRDFMSFFFAEIGAQIDWSTRPRFRDKELAGITFGAAPGELVADKLVEVGLRNGGSQWVLIHVEIQAQRDASLARRVFDYNYRIFKEYGQAVASLVLLADSDARWHPTVYRSMVLGTETRFCFPTAKLLDYTDRTDELLVSHNPFVWITLAHLRTQQAGHDPDRLYTAKWQLTKLLYQHGWRKQRIIVLFKVINWMMVLPELHQRRYWRAIRRLEKELKMEWIDPVEQSFIDKGLQKGLKKGLQQGVEQGLQQGLRQGAVLLLERQLVRRFGPLPATLRARLAKASIEQLGAWSEALLEAQSLKQVFA